MYNLHPMRAMYLLLILISSVSCYASCPYQCYVGEESYYLRRLREGGSEQTGWINGVHIGMDRMKPYGWYVGADYLYGDGYIHGKTGRGNPLNSNLTDQIFEARVGYTLQKDFKGCPFITPFAGWGHFKETNAFVSPSPLVYKTTEEFNFVVVGFLSGVNLTPLLSIGIYFKVRFMQDAESKIADDPYFDDVSLKMEDETLYRLEIPCNFTPCNSFLGIGGGLAPFYEFRHFGGREGYPFNFKDTKFHLFGLRLALSYRF